MTINLLHRLSRFECAFDRESETAFFIAHVPWVAPEAYFHIVFKPAPSVALADLSSRLRLPKSVVDFLGTQNGAHLFSGAFSVYGVHAPGQLLRRSDPFSLPPFNIEGEDRNWPPFDPDRFLALGGYGFDGTRVCIDRHDSSIHLFKRDRRTLSKTPSYSWSSLQDWLDSEIARLSVLFDKNGRILVKESETLPTLRTGVKPS